MEPLEIYRESEQRLNGTDNQHRDVAASSPESPSQSGDDRTRHDQYQEEAEDVVAVGEAAAADCVRSEKVAEQTEAKE
jgi:hypothetical protein